MQSSQAAVLSTWQQKTQFFLFSATEFQESLATWLIWKLALDELYVCSRSLKYELWLSTHLAGEEETSLEGWKDGDPFMQWEAFAGMLAWDIMESRKCSQGACNFKRRNWTKRTNMVCVDYYKLHLKRSHKKWVQRRDGKFMLLLLLSRFSCVWLCETPEMAAHQASPSLGFSRQEHWSGLPFPSPGKCIGRNEREQVKDLQNYRAAYANYIFNP